MDQEKNGTFDRPMPSGRCESTVVATQIEAIDMGRRGLHNEAATILMERLNGKVEIDFDTARRLFTLIMALHWKG